jgi:hypothetical protein
MPRGGYEEFVFRDFVQAQEFIDKHRGDLESSYKSFCSEESYFAGFDFVVQYSETDMGIWQTGVGTVVSKALQAKAFFGM